MFRYKQHAWIYSPLVVETHAEQFCGFGFTAAFNYHNKCTISAAKYKNMDVDAITLDKRKINGENIKPVTFPSMSKCQELF